MKRCQQCQVDNRNDAVFCSQCGAPLVAPTVPLDSPPSEPPELISRKPQSPSSVNQIIVATPTTQPPIPGHPRLVVAASGAYFDIQHRAELLIGRADPVNDIFPEIDLALHGADEGGISRKHCKIAREGNQYFIEDLNSQNGTWIGGTRLPANRRAPLKNGNRIRLGKLILNFFTG
jgi:hypothetical protein